MGNSHSQVLHSLGEAIRAIRRGYRFQDTTPDFPAIYYEEVSYEGAPYILPMIILKTRPCRWFMRSGGCTTCNYQAIAVQKEIPDSVILKQLDAAFKHLSQKREIPFIHLTSAGSFFDSWEISDPLLEAIAARLEKHHVRLFSTESRADVLLNDERLARFRKHYSGAVSVGIGLESVNSTIRELTVFKGISNSQFEQAVSNLKKHHMGFHAYVLIGKPFLTPGEDVDDAEATTRYAIELGGDVLLMLSNRQPNTLTMLLWKHGLYLFPSLWAPIEVLRRLPRELDRRIAIRGMDKAIPPPEGFAQTCGLCTNIVRSALIGFNWTKDYRMLEQATTSCPCYLQWKQTLEEAASEPLEQRVKRALDTLKTVLPQ